MTFLLDSEVVSRLEQYLPLRVDYDDKFWLGIRVTTSRRSAC